MALNRACLALLGAALLVATPNGQNATPAAQTADVLRGTIDIHVHSDPDNVPRSVDGLDAATQARAKGMRGIVLKNHYDPTAGLAYLARKAAPGLDVFGGIDLNLSVGGMNTAAVEHLTQVAGGWGRFVWMSTFDAENQVRYSKENRPFVSVSRNGALLPETKAVIGVIAKHRLVLATGHVSAQEALLLLREGQQQRVEHMVVTHAINAPVLMDVAQMQEAAKLGAFIEFVGQSVTSADAAARLDRFADAIRKVGPEFCILSSDLGQKNNALPVDGYAAFLLAMRARGFTDRDLDRMSKQNPARLLGLEAPRAERGGEWRSHGGDPGSTKYAPLDQIDKDNVSRLRIAWRRPAVDPSLAGGAADFSYSHDFRATPLMIDGVLYGSNGIGLVEAFHPGTGKTIWIQQPFPDEKDGRLRGNSTRAVAYWADAADRRLFAIRGEYLVALDPRTGAPIATWGDGGRVNLKRGLGPRATTYASSSGPQICGDVVMVGAQMTDAPQTKVQPPGDVQAFDVRSGAPRWTFHVIPQAGEVGNDTWERDSWAYSGNANLWSLISTDEELGLAYFPLTSPTSDMYGGHRLGNNLFSDTLVCVKCATGERVWHYQIVHHDLWDYDLPAAPILADITDVNNGGRRIKSVVQLTKHGFAFVFDRTNGKPVWPIEERPVPQSDTPGERTSPTQPFPTRPPPFERQGVTLDDLIDFTPELRAEALQLVKQYRIGPLFTPPSIRSDSAGGIKGTIQLPGSVGGADWQGAAFDRDRGMLYVTSITGPFVADLVKGDPKRTDLDYVPGLRAYPPGPQGLPLLKPPYGRITAIDLNQGDIVWTAAHGDGPRDHPLLKPLKLPPLGNPGRGGLFATRTLLFAGEGDPVMVRAGSRLRPEMPHSLAPGAGGNKFRAFDKATGAVVWETELPAGTTGAPITYMFDGQQFIVVAIGGADHDPEYVALSLKN
jgi:quinoprotein glucose dehydrogenase